MAGVGGARGGGEKFKLHLCTAYRALILSSRIAILQMFHYSFSFYQYCAL